MSLTFDEATHAYTLDGRRIPSVTEIAGILTAGKYATMNPAILEQAKRRGTLVHEYCEAIDCGIDPEELDIEPELVGYVNAYLAFLRDWQPEWDFIEKPVWTESYAGRADRIGRIDGKLCIADIKTGNMDKLSRLSLLFQLYGYKQAWYYMEDVYPSDIRGVGVKLKRDGKYTLHWDEDIWRRYLPHATEEYFWNTMVEITKLIGGYE